MQKKLCRRPFYHAQHQEIVVLLKENYFYESSKRRNEKDKNFVTFGGWRMGNDEYGIYLSLFP
jgi:hypothetical protein